MTIGIDILTGEKINFSHDRHYKGKSIVSFPDDYCVIDIETRKVYLYLWYAISTK